MKRYGRTGIAVILLFLVHHASVISEPIHRVTLSTIKTRPLSMGGAFTSVRDDLAALDFNPAAFTIDPLGGENRFHVFLNPFGPLIAFQNPSACKDLSVPIGWCLRGIGLSLGRVDVGVLLGEESLGNPGRFVRNSFWGADRYSTERNHQLGFSFSLSPKVSLGVAGEMLVRNRDWKKVNFGYRYGLLMQPRTNVTVGLFYVNLPDLYPNDRSVLERLTDETLNVGVSYSPWTFCRLDVDIRNVSDEDKAAVREPHMGIECTPVRHVAMRGGYARSTDGKMESFSFGFGLLDINKILWKTREFDRPFYCLQSGWIHQKQFGINSRWFFLSCLIRIG